MGLFNITIEKVIIRQDETEIIKRLKAIEDKIDKLSDDPKGELKQAISDKLKAIKKDLESTV